MVILVEEVYIEQPPEFVARGEMCSIVCRLDKALYGLKQSPQGWFGKFRTVLQQFSIIHNKANHSMFHNHSSSGQCTYLVVNVDNIVIIGDEQ